MEDVAASHGPIMAGLSVDHTWDNATATHGNLDVSHAEHRPRRPRRHNRGLHRNGPNHHPQQLGDELGRSWLRLCNAGLHCWRVLQRIVRSDGLIDVPLTKSDNGRVVRLHTGDAISLVLPSNAAAGYRWTCDVQENDVVAVEPAEYRSSHTAVGSAGDETWMIRPRGKGRAVLHWRYWRPWEGESSVIERFELTVDAAS